jgi:Fe-S cluster assembly iron-binding protein IscA
MACNCLQYQVRLEVEEEAYGDDKSHKGKARVAIKGKRLPWLNLLVN